MQEVLADVEVGGRYCIIDWTIIPMEATEIEFEGLYARHQFDALPQVKSLKDRSLLEPELLNEVYWLQNRLPEDD